MKIELSQRLAAVVSMVTAKGCVCDVGCDHGFVSMYLIENRICQKVIAMDVNEGPLSCARNHIEERGLSDYIDTRLSDGLSALSPGEAQALICAGMGGGLIRKILTQGRQKALLMKELILQPQSQMKETRRYLRENGFQIADEKMVVEEGKFYPMLRVLPGESKALATETDDQFGTILMQKKDPVLIQFLYKERAICEEILLRLMEAENSERQSARYEEIKKKMKSMEEALVRMEAMDEM